MSRSLASPSSAPNSLSSTSPSPHLLLDHLHHDSSNHNGSGSTENEENPFPSSPSSMIAAPADLPSIFELMAADELKNLIQPAFRYVLAFFAQRYPRYLLRFINRHEETYALLMLLVEGHHLRKYDSTFAGHFYGLRLRTTSASASTRGKDKGKAGASPSPTSLSNRQKAFYLAFIVGIPYVRTKLQDLYERMGGGLDPTLEIGDDEHGSTATDQYGRITTPTSRLKRMIHRLFKRLYPYANLSWELYVLAHDMAYMFDRTTSWRPWHKWLGLQVAREPSDSMPLPVTSSSPSAINRRPFLIRLVFGHLPSFLSTATSNLLPLTLLSLKFLQWWYSPQSPRTINMGVEDKTNIPSPSVFYPSEKGETLLNLERRKEKDSRTDGDEEEEQEKSDGLDIPDETSAKQEKPLVANAFSPNRLTPTCFTEKTSLFKPISYGICPICGDSWQNPTITPSGYVGCYLCLHGLVEKNGKCPVTGMSMAVEQLRKVVV